MAIAAQNLWPADKLSVSVRTPLAIMRIQAEMLTEITQHILEGSVQTVTTEGQGVEHYFEVVASALNGYRVRILSAKRSVDNVYPVTLTGVGIPDYQGYVEAQTEEDFVEELSKCLKSNEMIGLLQSLIARVNETRPEDALSPAR